jgi:hypothetical protein
VALYEDCLQFYWYIAIEVYKKEDTCISLCVKNSPADTPDALFIQEFKPSYVIF